MYKRMYKKLAIFLLALLGNIGMVLISPVMADLLVDFPTASEAMLGMVVTLPAFTLIPATLFASSVLVTKVERKNIILAAYILALIGGIMPAFCHSLPLIMVFRAILGIGMGLLTPIAITYISQYPENERASMFGFSQTINCLLTAGILLLIGPVSKVAGWRGAFLMYSIILIPFIIVMTGIPRTGKLGTQKAADATGEIKKMRLTKNVVVSIVIFCVSLFFSQAAQGAAMSSISFYIEQYQLGGTQLASIASSIGTIGLAIGAALFPLLMKHCKAWSGIILLLAAMAAFLIYSVHSVASVIIGYALIIVLTSLYAVFTSTTISLIVPLQRVAIISSITVVCIFLGQFIAPTLQAGLAKLLHIEGINAMLYVAMAVMVLVLAIINIPFKKKNASSGGNDSAANIDAAAQK